MDKNSPKIIFWGTPEFAIPTLRALIQNNYSVALVVTKPDEPVGRKQIFTPPPVKIFAQKHHVPVFQPQVLKSEFLKDGLPKADLFVIAAYGKIIPKEILEVTQFGALNIHPSLLPRWRGPSPIQYTIFNGDIKTGVTIIKMDEMIDHGPILAQRELGISDFRFPIAKATYRELHDELAKLGAKLLVETLPKYLKGEIEPIPQDDLKATYSKILKKEDGRINWSRQAEELVRMSRAFSVWPVAWTLWPAPSKILSEVRRSHLKRYHQPVQSKIFRVKIYDAEFISDEPALGSPGYIWQKSGHPMLVKTGLGSLGIKKLTIEGKKQVFAEEFIKGYKEIIGSTFV